MIKSTFKVHLYKLYRILLLYDQPNEELSILMIFKLNMLWNEVGNYVKMFLYPQTLFLIMLAHSNSI